MFNLWNINDLPIRTHSFQEGGGGVQILWKFFFASDFKHRPLGKKERRRGRKNEKQTLGKEEKRNGGGWSSVSYDLKEEEVFSWAHFGVVESHKGTDKQPVESDEDCKIVTF